MKSRLIIKACNFVVKIVAFSLCLLTLSCSPKIIEKVVRETEYRDRVVHDTAKVEIPVEVEKIVTRDTVSHLENTYAKSDASVSNGLLSHSLESIPQVVRVPIEVHVTDTLWRESEVRTEVVEVEKKMNWWQRFRLDGFWVLLGLSAVLLLWIFRKYIIK